MLDIIINFHKPITFKELTNHKVKRLQSSVDESHKIEYKLYKIAKA